MQPQDTIADAVRASKVRLPARNGLVIGSNNYVVVVGFGSPVKEQAVVFDTGSSQCWIQCRPCLGGCYTQHDPLFDPRTSRSYHNVSCNSPMCNIPFPKLCDGDNCLYKTVYGDDSSTEGWLATDKLRLATAVFHNFTFGCGQRNRGSFRGSAGILGLGRYPNSLVSQTSTRLGQVFSYCLPTKKSITGYLTLGGSSSRELPATSYTPLLFPTGLDDTYRVELQAISVGRRRLGIHPSASRNPSIIIDSGTAITRLPPASYNELKAHFRRAMDRYPQAAAFSILDTCYNLEGVRDPTFPAITLHFTNLDLRLTPPQVFVHGSRTQTCLAFAATENRELPTIIGSTQQLGMDVIYDIPRERIGFAPGNCG